MDTIWDADLQSAVLKAKDHRLKAERLSLGYEGKSVCNALDLAIPHGKFSVIVGPNGCGKSTLLKSLCRLLKPLAGQVLLDGQNIHQLPTKVVAKQLGLLPQSALTPEGIKVVDLVSRGRYPHQGLFRQWSGADEQAVEEAMRATHVHELAQHSVISFPVVSVSGFGWPWHSRSKRRIYCLMNPPLILILLTKSNCSISFGGLIVSKDIL